MTQRHPLNDSDFALIVENTPLVSIDVVMRDPQGHALVGLRTNEPAKDTYFVPGGVIRKNETVDAAFSRIVAVETGLRASLPDAEFLGVYQHLYDTNRFGTPGYGTHYVVLGYALPLEARPDIVLDTQHKEVRWMSPEEILAAPDVHPNTKAYFSDRPSTKCG